MKLKKNSGLLALLLTLAMVLSLIPTAAFAETDKITEVWLAYDKAAINFNTHFREGEVTSRFIESASTTTEGVRIDRGNSYLSKKVGSDWHGTGDGMSMISAEAEYAVAFNINVESGYDWIDKKDDTSIKF